ncbi:thioredoxin family protein [Neotamlana laminarinivorans]|uniref:Thioredoxin family protein n=1 Tax=Neotamlana laminarinivorans TaxID=2883124 RepID=A0A9X1I1U0_9FLAO|nr:thioredoxin family protein [Tamlana laminarinivorans]MCB4799861.1 thioredoxin family protein [Tamlana laminarinivorans]
MSKFGELIDVEIPVLLQFYTSWNPDEAKYLHQNLHDVAETLGNKVKVIKIDVDKNQDLAKALRIKTLPTLIIYKHGEMQWRQSGEQQVNAILSKVEEYI